MTVKVSGLLAGGNMAKKIKSFLFSLIIILLFAAAVFYLGWTQIKIKPNHIGVVVSKTGGVSQKIAESGKFSWYWEFLLPTNATLRSFSVLPYNFSKKISGQLPSADIFRNYSSLRPDFSYSADISITIEITKEQIVALCKKNIISDQESLNQFMEKKASFLVEETEKKLFEYYLGENTSSSAYYLDSRNIFADSAFYSQKDAEGIEVTAFSITNQKFPDGDLYRLAKKTAMTSLVKESENIISQSSFLSSSGSLNKDLLNSAPSTSSMEDVQNSYKSDEKNVSGQEEKTAKEEDFLSDEEKSFKEFYRMWKKYSEAEKE